MQLLQDSLHPVKDSVNVDSFIQHNVIGISSLKKDTFRAGSKETFVNLYLGHELKTKHESVQPINHEKADWVFFLILFIVAVFTYLRVVYGKYLRRLVSAFFNFNITNQMVRDENILVQRASLLLNFIFYTAIALLLFLISDHYDWHLNGIKIGFSRFLFFGILVTALYFLKLFVLRITGWIFEVNKEMSAYIFNIFLINNLLGIALIPLLIFFVFWGSMHMSWLLTIAVILIGCTYIYRLLRGFFIGLSASIASVAYLFLYICALEIAPLFVLIKLISQQ